MEHITNDFFNCNTGYEICITVYNEKKKTRDLSLIRFTCDMVDASVGPLVNMKKHLIYAMYQCHSSNGKSFRSFVSLDTHTALPVLCRITTQRSSCSHRVCFRRRELELTNPETFTQEIMVFIKCPNLDAVWLVLWKVGAVRKFLQAGPKCFDQGFPESTEWCQVSQPYTNAVGDWGDEEECDKICPQQCERLMKSNREWLL